MPRYRLTMYAAILKILAHKYVDLQLGRYPGTSLKNIFITEFSNIILGIFF